MSAAPAPTPAGAAATTGGPSTGAAPLGDGWRAGDLLAATADELAPAARSTRDAAHGRRITYSPKVFIPLTMLC
ncbi:MAG: hypothetical protein ACRDYZ_11575, partial [Acidimicrobiales bacterium]